MKRFLLLFLPIMGLSSALTVRNYYNSNVSSITGSNKFPTANASICQEHCDNATCPAYNFDPDKGICQLIELTSSTKPQFACSHAIPVTIAYCSYELAEEEDMCYACEKVIIENVGQAVKASCPSGKTLVYVDEDAERNVFTKSHLYCNLTSGWTHNGTVVGSSIIMGCTTENGGYTTVHTPDLSQSSSASTMVEETTQVDSLDDLTLEGNVLCSGHKCSCEGNGDLKAQNDESWATGLELQRIGNEWVLYGSSKAQNYSMGPGKMTLSCSTSSRAFGPPSCVIPVVVRGKYAASSVSCGQAQAYFDKAQDVNGKLCSSMGAQMCSPTGYLCDTVPFVPSVVYCTPW